MKLSGAGRLIAAKGHRRPAGVDKRAFRPRASSKPGSMADSLMVTVLGAAGMKPAVGCR